MSRLYNITPNAHAGTETNETYAITSTTFGASTRPHCRSFSVRLCEICPSLKPFHMVRKSLLKGSGLEL